MIVPHSWFRICEICSETPIHPTLRSQMFVYMYCDVTVNGCHRTRLHGTQGPRRYATHTYSLFTPKKTSLSINFQWRAGFSQSEQTILTLTSSIIERKYRIHCLTTQQGVTLTVVLLSGAGRTFIWTSEFYQLLAQWTCSFSGIHILFSIHVSRRWTSQSVTLTSNQRPDGLYSSALLFCALASNVLLKSRPVYEGMNS